MLLVDGAEYEEWTLDSKDKLTEDNLEQMVVEHSDDIFGQDSIYLDKRHKLQTITGVGSIPDGFAIVFGNQPEWYIVEVELSSHDIYDHVVKQVTRFMEGIENLNSKDNLFEAMWNGINSSHLLKYRLEKASGSSNPHWFLSNIIKKSLPIVTLIIEKEQSGLEGTLSKFTYLPHKIVEFQTFRRVGAEAVHAHLFEPLCTYSLQEPAPIPPAQPPIGGETSPVGAALRPLNLRELVEVGVITAGQVIFKVYKSQRFEGKVLNDGSIELSASGKRFDSLSMAAVHITRHNVNGWRWWHTSGKDGTECKLADIRKRYF